MTGGPARPGFSVCIPAYNRAAYLLPLLDSIAQQDGADCEILITEDASPQREQILNLAADWSARTGRALRIECNPSNLGYDGNIRRLVELARGRYCFFMGNDDLMAPGALSTCAAALARHPGAGMLLRGYSWFDTDPARPAGTVRYVTREAYLGAGAESLALCYRRSGIISGYVVDRDLAAAAASSAFDGSLYYQMHLTASVLKQRGAVVTPEVLVYCRTGQAPEFGAALAERGVHRPGRYTPDARLAMVAGALRILASHSKDIGQEAHSRILQDYARHFYPFVRDQLDLSPSDYWSLCRACARLELGRYPSFYLNCIIPYVLGKSSTDWLLSTIRRWLGHTPRLS